MEVSVAQVARRYAPESAPGAVDTPFYLRVVILNPARSEVARPDLSNSVLPDCQIEIELAGGRRLRISGVYDARALARLIRGMSG
jgi:transposase